MVMLTEMPEFKHQEHPKEVTVKSLMYGFVMGPQPIQKIVPKITPLAASPAAQNIEREVTQPRMLSDPYTVGQTKSVLSLRNDFRRKNTSSRVPSSRLFRGGRSGFFHFQFR